MRALVLLYLAASVAACNMALTGRGAPRTSIEADTTSSVESCRFPSAPVVVKRHGNAVLQYWDLEERALWSESLLPADSAYTQYRHRVEEAGAVQARPLQHVPEAERGSEIWHRELHNVERAYSTEAGTLRPVRCLDALLFAYQNARYQQIDHPTEFLASVLRKRVGDRTVLRVYFGAGDELFPPKVVYGFDEVGRDLSAGWEYVVMLHNHTVQDAAGKLRLGVPAPSASDVQLLNGLVERYGLRRAWVTNGFYTLDIPARDLDQYVGAE